MVIDYSAFVIICRVTNTKNFGGFNVKTDGLYTIVPDDDDHPLQLSPTERAVLSWHPTGINKNPALPLPCTLEELRSFVANAGLQGCIDEYAVAEMLQEAGDTAQAQAAYDEAGLNGKAIDWRYWVHQMPVLNAMQAACLMSALEPHIFSNLNERPGKVDPAKSIEKARKIQLLTEAKTG